MIYNLAMSLFKLLLRVLGLFNDKIKLGVLGRSKTFQLIEQQIQRDDKVIWFHCASLGEYEQGLPVFNEIRTTYDSHKIVLSFFSPSGYSIRKNTDIADVVCYLPIDTPSNAKRFIEYLRPELSVFVKYDIWPNYMLALKNKGLKAILISASFRKSQLYFKWYGKRFRRALNSFDQIFVQETQSAALLKSIDFKDTIVAGDTRYDRVTEQLKADNNLPWLREFKKDKVLIIFGSTWPEDETIIIKYINNHDNKNCRFLIVPHEVNPQHIDSIATKLNKNNTRLSKIEKKIEQDIEVLIVDSIGHLSKAYSYADIAYVGGAMGKTGLHNILEPAVFGVPILIGPNHSKFPEAQLLIENGGLYSISSLKEFNTILNKLIGDAQLRNKKGALNKKLIEKKKGAVIQIMNYVRI